MAEKYERLPKTKWNEIHTFNVKTLQILDEKGKVVSEMPKLAESDLKAMYKHMLLGRVLDDKMLSLQRQGRLGTFAQIKGQEASNVGSAYALDKDDWVFQSFRENASVVLRGVPLEKLLLYYGWDERGNSYPESVNVFPVSVPVSTQMLHATGFAWAQKIQGKKTATMVYFGDGATSEGDFHEAMNFAGVFKLPIVFVCQNNQFAISVPREKQSVSGTLAQKAIAYGFEGIQVDGNDILAVYKASKDAVEKARKGDGPTLIECYTYRIGDHTTADDAKKYRTEKELSEWIKRDPIERLRKYMESKKIWSKKDEKKLLAELQKIVDVAVKKAESIKDPPIEDIFKYMYAEMPWFLKEQMEEAYGEVR